ncbi:hypothetical protein NHG33_08010 [Aerococcaceae bacterium NML130460]|nr:hypothetical protein [Aerococcaceae bacterium NML130460]
MQLGEWIKQLREEKGLSIKDVCGNRISRSAYSRFVAGETDMYASNFFYLLKRLNVTLEEFMYIKNGYSESEITIFFKEIQQIMISKNIKKLVELRDECYSLSESLNDQKQHMGLICDIYLKRSGESPFNSDAEKNLKAYFNNTLSWTAYELILFNNCLHIFDVSYVKIVSKRVISGFKRYEKLSKMSNNLVRFLVNLGIYYLQKGEVQFAKEIVQFACELNIEEQQIFDRVSINFIEGIYSLKIGQHNKGYNLLKKVFLITEILQLNDCRALFRNILSETGITIDKLRPD